MLFFNAKENCPSNLFTTCQIKKKNSQSLYFVPDSFSGDQFFVDRNFLVQAELQSVQLLVLFQVLSEILLRSCQLQPHSCQLVVLLLVLISQPFFQIGYQLFQSFFLKDFLWLAKFLFIKYVQYVVSIFNNFLLSIVNIKT